MGVSLAIGETFGKAVALVLVWFFLSNCAIYNYSFGRLLFVSGLEKRLPAPVRKGEQEQGPGERGAAAHGARLDHHDRATSCSESSRTRTSSCRSTPCTPR